MTLNFCLRVEFQLSILWGDIMYVGIVGSRVGLILFPLNNGRVCTGYQIVVRAAGKGESEIL